MLKANVLFCSKTLLHLLTSVMFGMLCFCVSGCRDDEKNTSSETLPNVYTNRMQDVSYQDALRESRTRQATMREPLQRVALKMESLEKAARQALPADADAKAVLAELNDHPEKYPEWKSLSEQQVKLLAALNNERREVTARVIRERMLQEARDLEAVQQGAARPKVLPTTTK